MTRARAGPAAALRAAAALGLLAASAAWGAPSRAAGAAVPGLAEPGDCPPLGGGAPAAGRARPAAVPGTAHAHVTRQVAAAPRAGDATRAAPPAAAATTGAALAAAEPGEIVDLPAPAAPPTAGPGPAAVLVVLPRGAAGTGAGELELGEGARIEASFFSPVACAVVARVVGPPGAAPEALVPRLPETALRVADATYLTAAQARPERAPGDDEEQPGASRTRGRSAGAAARRAPVEPDPYRDLQHGLARSGAPEAWPVSDGRGAVVAILDSLPALDHRELGAVEAAGDEAPGDPALHGSLVAGVVAAAAGNGFGIAGVAPGARVLAVPVCTARAGGLPDACRLFDVVRGIDRAWDGGARILNLALVGPPNALLERTLARLDGLGAVAVAAAGNDGGREPRYPAAYPTVVGVTAIDREGRLWSRANRGPGAEIAAPGVEVLSTVPGDAFAFADGSSLAAAHVSGLLALLASVAEDPPSARRALFRAGHEPETALAPGLAALPRACDALARLGRPCPEAAAQP